MTNMNDFDKLDSIVDNIYAAKLACQAGDIVKVYVFLHRTVRQIKFFQAKIEKRQRLGGKSLKLLLALGESKKEKQLFPAITTFDQRKPSHAKL